MAENVVFTGIGRSEKPKKRLADRVFERVRNRLKQNTGEIVEKKWMDAYKRVLAATDSGMRKKIVEKIKIMAQANAKLQRFGTHILDTSASGVGMMLGAVSLADVVAPRWMRSHGWDLHENDSEARLEGAQVAAFSAGAAVLGEMKMAHVTSGWLADIVGSGGEKVAQITSKILRGKPKPSFA